MVAAPTCEIEYAFEIGVAAPLNGSGNYFAIGSAAYLGVLECARGAAAPSGENENPIEIGAAAPSGEIGNPIEIGAAAPSPDIGNSFEIGTATPSMRMEIPLK